MKANEYAEYPIIRFSPSSECVDPIRCIQDEMGCPLAEGENGRLMESDGSRVPHQLPNAFDHISSNSEMCQGSDQPDNLHPDKQCDSQNLHH